MAVFKEDPDSRDLLVQEALPVFLDLKELRDYQEVKEVLVRLVHPDQMVHLDLLDFQVGLEDLVQQVRCNQINVFKKVILFTFV